MQHKPYELYVFFVLSYAILWFDIDTIAHMIYNCPRIYPEIYGLGFQINSESTQGVHLNFRIVNMTVIKIKQNSMYVFRYM